MTPVDIRRLLAQTGLRPSRAAGQHFLLDESVVDRMVDIAQVGAKDTVLEIGPGFGLLTAKLLARGATVVGVELDRRLAAYLRRKFVGHENLTLLEGDVFRVRLDQLLTDHQFKLVANLPYSATSMVFRHFLTLTPRPSSMVVLVQKEVAERITAAPGAMSLLSLAVQYYGQPKKLFDVAPEKFFPPPAVISSALMVDNLTSGEPEIAKEMFRLARMAFAGRRKQLKNTLAGGLKIRPEKVIKWLMLNEIGPEARPQDLSVDNWLTLAKNTDKIENI